MSSTANVAVGRPAVRPPSPGLAHFMHQTGVVLSTLLNPRRVIAEVEEMARLHREAASIESTDPVRAARLRDQAARIGLL